MPASSAFTLENKRIWVAGHNGMVGSALVRRLAQEKCTILTADRGSLDLMDQAATRAWISEAKLDVVIVAAAKVGGVLANNTYPAEFLYNNLVIETNLIEAAYRNEVQKLLFLGSSCIYPRMAAQPIFEEELLSGPLEPTNEWYAVAKIAGIKLCQAYRRQYGCDFISAMPANLYGPNDNFDLKTSHVIPALMRKVHEAKLAGADTVTIWGTGKPRREFLHVDDCADACIHLLKNYSGEGHINVGSGTDIAINEIAQMVCRIVGFSGTLSHDLSKLDGAPRRLMNADKLRAMNWQPSISLESGLKSSYEWFLNRVGARVL